MRKDSSTVLQRLERDVERATKQSPEQLRMKSVEDLRAEATSKSGRAMRFFSAFPVIGRGNVLRDRIVERRKIDAEIDEMLNRQTDTRE